MATEWIENRIEFLPGNSWPEAWIVSKHTTGAFAELVGEFGVDEGVFQSYMDEAVTANKHDELHALSQKLHLPIDAVVGRFAKSALDHSKDEVDSLVTFIQGYLT